MLQSDNKRTDVSSSKNIIRFIQQLIRNTMNQQYLLINTHTHTQQEYIVCQCSHTNTCQKHSITMVHPQPNNNTTVIWLQTVCLNKPPWYLFICLHTNNKISMVLKTMHHGITIFFGHIPCCRNYFWDVYHGTLVSVLTSQKYHCITTVHDQNTKKYNVTSI